VAWRRIEGWEREIAAATMARVCGRDGCREGGQSVHGGRYFIPDKPRMVVRCFGQISK
jgi:hypothetical protein